MVVATKCARNSLDFCLILLVTVQSTCSPARSQTSQPSSSTSRLTLQAPIEQTGTGIVRDGLGRPCLDVEAAARGHVANPQVVDHVVSVKNNCPRVIKVKACYYGSDRCNNLVLQPYGRVDTILGTMSGVTTFRYSLSQQ